MNDEKVRPFLTRPAVIDWLQWNDFGEHLVKPDMAQVALSLIEEYRVALRESQAETERQSTRADALLKLTEEFQADLRETRAREAKLREALESCAGVIDTDFIKSETEDGEVEYWINDQTIQHIVEEALKETKP